MKGSPLENQKNEQRLNAVKTYLRDKRLLTGAKKGFYKSLAIIVTKEAGLDFSDNKLSAKEVQKILEQLVTEKWAKKREYQNLRIGGIWCVEYKGDITALKRRGGPVKTRDSPSHSGTQ
jgi:hypothetical protein